MEAPYSEFALDRANSFFDDDVASQNIGTRAVVPFPGVEIVGTVAREASRAVHPKKIEPASYAFKRVIDVSLALTTLVVLAPLLATIWLLVLRTSPGPGLYWSSRVGRFGRAFRMPKFRTMTNLAPVGPRETLVDAQAYITPIGAFLRRTSLDELPQLYCVLRGDMSLVGPRPLLANDPGALARQEFPAALDAKPGLTGIAQVSGRNEVSARRKARLDALYARSVSFSIDVGIILRTVKILFTGRGFV